MRAASTRIFMLSYYTNATRVSRISANNRTCKANIVNNYICALFLFFSFCFSLYSMSNS